jgi:proteasome accessory factor B
VAARGLTLTDMSKRRTERLLSIVVLLLSTRRYLTAEQIRAAVHGYPASDDAFDRMFERDKDELRELGIPLEVGLVDPLESDQGYRIRQQDYELPEIRLEPDEAAVLQLAARVWQSAELEGAAAGALLKLRAAGLEEAPTRPGIEPRLRTDPAFGPLWEAVRDRRPVTFKHRSSGKGEVVSRTIEPWGVVNRRGKWYVAGFDRKRAATRVFRLSRIVGPVKMAGPVGSVTVPPDVDVRALVKDWDAAPAPERAAVLRVRKGAAIGLRRGATVTTPGDDGWDTLTTRFGDVPWYSEYVASFGPSVVVVDPPDLRDDVISRLKGALS